MGWRKSPGGSVGGPVRRWPRGERRISILARRCNPNSRHPLGRQGLGTGRCITTPTSPSTLWQMVSGSETSTRLIALRTSPLRRSPPVHTSSYTRPPVSEQLLSATPPQLPEPTWALPVRRAPRSGVRPLVGAPRTKRSRWALQASVSTCWRVRMTSSARP
jgi:hypothetical protein